MVFATNQSLHYREQAEKLRRAAAGSDTGEVKEQLLMAARDYDKLADRGGKNRRSA